MNGLLKKSLISVAEAVSTILTPEPVSYLSFILNANREKEYSTALLKITASYTQTHRQSFKQDFFSVKNTMLAKLQSNISIQHYI